MNEHDACIPDARLAYGLDDGIGARASIGLIVLATDRTLEHEWGRLLALSEVAFYTTRMPAGTEAGAVGLERLLEDLRPAGELLVPGVELDVIAFGCTSATSVIGENRIFEALLATHPEADPTTPLTAAMAALEALGAERIAVVTPYSDEINAIEAGYLRDHGIAVRRLVTFGEIDDLAAGRVSADSLRRAVVCAGEDAKAEAVFVSCTSLRCAHLLSALADGIGRPVLSSNQALAWHALRLAGVTDPVPALACLSRLQVRPSAKADSRPGVQA